MATAVSLSQAARQTWENLSPLVTANTLRAQILAFTAAIKPSFSEQAVKANHPVANWISVLEAWATIMVNDWPDLRTAADYVYRLCWMAHQQSVGSPSLPITPAQAALVLAQYNAKF